MNLISNSFHVYYLPVGLTQLQKDIVEILISLHAESFLKEYSPKDIKKLNIHNNEKPSNELTFPPLTPVQLNHMFFQNIRAVLNHPCLLVDHYMPRNFLLMEPSEKLVITSDKFRKLNQLISSVIDRDRSKKPSFQLAIISSSVKDLDLIEGFALGQPFKFKRLSGTSIFDEKHVYDGSNQPSLTCKDAFISSRSIPCDSNRNVGDVGSTTKKSHHYRNFQKKVSKNNNNEDWLFLATTTHLANCNDLFSQYDIDMIISFDSLININLPSLQNIVCKNKNIPLINLLVLNSPDYYMLNQDKLHEEQDEHLCDSLAYFIRNREFLLNKDQLISDFKPIIKHLLNGNYNPPGLPKLEIVKNSKDLVSYLNNPILLTDHSHYSEITFILRIHHGDFDVKTYQSTLKSLIALRLRVCQLEFDATQKQVLKKRLRETERQNQFDKTKDEVSQMFKMLESEKTKLDNLVSILEKSKYELESLRETETILKKRKETLEIWNSMDSVDNELLSTKERLLNLKRDSNLILENNSLQDKENEDIRFNYQKLTSDAADQVSLLKSLTESKELLEKRLNGPFIKLYTLFSEQKKKKATQKLTQLKHQNKFLAHYIKQIRKQYNITSPTKKSLNESNKNNLGVGRVRTTRATALNHVQ